MVKEAVVRDHQVTAGLHSEAKKENSVMPLCKYRMSMLYITND